MSKPDSYERMGKLATAILAAGDEIIGSMNDHSETGDLVYDIQRHEAKLQAATSNGVRYVEIVYGFELSNQLKSGFSAEQATQLLSNDEIQSCETDGELMKRAAIWQLDSHDEEEMNEAYNDAMDKVGTEVNWATNYAPVPNGQVQDGMELRRRVYPGEESFSVGEYDQTARWLRTYGVQAAQTLIDSLSLFESEADHSDVATEAADSSPRAFQ